MIEAELAGKPEQQIELIAPMMKMQVVINVFLRCGSRNRSSTDATRATLGRVQNDLFLDRRCLECQKLRASTSPPGEIIWESPGDIVGIHM